VIAPGGCTLGATTTEPSTDGTSSTTSADTTTSVQNTEQTGTTAVDEFTTNSQVTTEAPLTDTTPDEATTDVTDPSSPPEVPLCPPGTFGNVPHPERCDAFYMCVGGVAIPFNCGKGFEFDPTLKVNKVPTFVFLRFMRNYSNFMHRNIPQML
jgi:hypothetical protein